MNDQESDIKRDMEIEVRRQALADYLHASLADVSTCSTRLNDIATFQHGQKIYIVGTEEEVDAGVRGYFEHNLGDLDSAFIGSRAGLSAGDTAVVDRLCSIMDEEIETEVLNDALLSIVRKCGDLSSLVDAAVTEVDRKEFLSEDGREIPFGKFLIYRFKQGQCSDFNY